MLTNTISRILNNCVITLQLYHLIYAYAVKGVVPTFNATLRGRAFLYHSVNVTRNQSSLHLLIWDPKENTTKTKFFICLQKVNEFAKLKIDVIAPPILEF